MALRRHRVQTTPKPKVAAVPSPPPAPPQPVWPANQPPNAAKITWDSQGLMIDASNSSLGQILHEVSVDTGTKIQGFGDDKDPRIFGTYGPGPARAVLSRLLDGSGYDVLMIGGQGDEPPQQVILSKSVPAGPQPPASRQSQNDDDQDQADNPPGWNYRRPDGSPFPGRTPDQMLEMREQQMRRMHAQQQGQDNSGQQDNSQQ